VLRIQYADYSHWIRNRQSGERHRQKHEFWRQTLADVKPFSLPPDFTRPAVQSTKGAVITFEVSEALKTQLDDLCHKEASTLFMTLLAIFKTLLYRYTNEEDICIGTVVANRNAADVEGLIGYFSNTVPLRTKIRGDQSFSKLLETIRTSTLAAFDHQDVPFEEVVEVLAPKRDLSRSPVFQIMFLHQRVDEVFSAKRTMSSIELIEEEFETHTSKFDLTLHVSEKSKSLNISLEYCTDLFLPSTIERLATNLQRLMQFVVQNSDCNVDELSIMSEEDRHRLLHTFNNTALNFDGNDTVVSIFERQAIAFADRIALEFEDNAVSYRQLNERANQFAHYLQRLGIEREQLVPICFERGIDMVVAILAVLKTGAAYVPLDPDYPSARLDYVIDDTKAEWILVTNKTESLFQQSGKKIISFNTITSEINEQSKEDLNLVIDPELLAYVIYTSGSTGRPKGVMIEHRNVVNFIYAMNHKLPLTEFDHILSITSISFDISVLELIWSLCRGVRVSMRDPRSGDYRQDHVDAPTGLDFSLFFFSSDEDLEKQNKYDLLLQSAKFSDENDFAGIWLPERHFHSFGGIFPAPSVLAAALSMITKRIELRAGSVVLPLNDVMKVAEEWSVVDNLSNGRVSLSFASGWHPDDFVLAPENFKNRKKLMYEQIEQFYALWQGESLTRTNGVGKEVEIKTFPRPFRKNIPIWITTSGSRETFESAGERGADILTHLLGQTLDELRGNIEAYKNALRRSGHATEGKRIALMVHTFIGEDMESVKQEVREPFKKYLRSSIDLLKRLAPEADLSQDLNGAKLDEILEIVFQRYWQTSALFGTLESTNEFVRKIASVGVTEIACLVDFGLPDKKVVKGLPLLNRLREKLRKTKAPRGERPSISAIQATPSYLRALIDNQLNEKFLKGLKHIIIGGEKLPIELVEKLFSITDANIFNMYGPTETTVWSAVGYIRPGEDVTIGKPIANTQIYILDHRDKLTPIGVPGQLCIGGRGVARGYWGKPDLSKEKFVINPFSKNPHSKLYKTGDLARWTDSGELEFIGRIDNQLKINGFRVEPGEIEYIVNESGLVQQVVVVPVHNETKDTHLVGYIVSSNNVNTEELSTYVKARVPSYMVPSVWLQIEELPFTPNGKIDRKSLQERPVDFVTSESFAEPENQLEFRVCAVWQEVLRRERIGCNDNFFEIGGDSILTIQVANRLKVEGIDVSPKDIFLNQTVRKLCNFISTHKSTNMSTEQGILTGPSGLTPIQHWFFQSENFSVAHYNQSVLLEIDKSITAAQLTDCVQSLIMQHDALRFTYIQSPDGWMQEYQEKKIIRVIEDDLSNFTEGEFVTKLQELTNDYQSIPSLEKGELLGAVLIQTPTFLSHNRFLVIVHHLVIDGVSWRILFEDLNSLLSAKKKESVVVERMKGTSYRQWFNALKNYGRSKRLNSQIAFWENVVLHNNPLPVDYPSAEKVRRREFHGFHRTLSRAQTELLLHRVPVVYHTEINDLLLCALGKTLIEWSKSEAVVIGLEGHGREEIESGLDLSRTVGWFTSMYPLLIKVHRNASVEQWITQVKEQLRKIPDKGVGFGVLRYLNKEKSLQGAAPWDVLFNYLGQTDIAVADNAWFTPAKESYGQSIHPETFLSEKIVINSFIVNGELTFSWSYSTKHYDSGTIGKIADLFIANLQLLIDHCMLLGKEQSIYTPSDFGLGNEIDNKELSAFLKERSSKNQIMEF
jgi:natural product biosynthesis luciferase-like monooxygenase protein/non-ribosomal peptide synthase protein (TIGR01720 family)